MARLFLRICVFGIAVMFGGAGWVESHAQAQDAQSGKTDKKPAPSVVVYTVQPSEIADQIEALGTLKANESIAITATVTEKITALHFDDGQRVEQGDVLVEMTSDEEHALLEEARANLSEARKQYKRIKTLAETNAASKSLLDQRKREVETAKARLHAVESRMSDRLLKAAFSGVVGLRNISVGALVEPGNVITTLYDDSLMKLDFSVPATYITILKPGMPIIAEARAFGDRAFNGVVKSVDAAVDPITRSVLVRAQLQNPDAELKPGILMSVELFKNPRMALVVPEEAIVMEGNRHYIFAMTADNIADKRQVHIGRRFKGSLEILDGVKAGDTIITRGMLNVRAGQPVAVTAHDDGQQPASELLQQTEMPSQNQGL